MNYDQFKNLSCSEEFEMQCTLAGISKIDTLKEIGIKVKDDSIRLIDSYRDEHFFRDVYLIKDNITIPTINKAKISIQIVIVGIIFLFDIIIS